MLACAEMIPDVSANADLWKARAALVLSAREHLADFARVTSPVPSDQLNPAASMFSVARHHAAIAEALEKVERGEIRRLMICLPYRHGKTELGVRKFIPWYLGRNPGKSVICVTHTDTLACEHGRDVRNVILGPGWKPVFGKNPMCDLRNDSQARDRLQMVGGGTAMFTGRGGLGGGFGADLIIFDDFFKNAEEAGSQATRDHAWHCYISDCKSRLNDKTGAVVMIGTRKHEDDVQGRILDPTNPHYDEREAKQWTVIRLPALAEDNDPLGRAVDEPLWPERFDFEFWNSQRTHASELVRMDFNVQGQCNPVPMEGNWFKRTWLSIYVPEQLPKSLRYYAASDHAVHGGAHNDKSCLLVAGIDPSGILWVLPQTWWKRGETDEMTEAMISLMKRFKITCWFAAKDQISGSVGPFLRRRMKEERVFQYIQETAERESLREKRTVSIRNMMAMGMVKFPKRADWWPEAEKELLAFPNGKHDDFVAALALLGMGLDSVFSAERPKVDATPKPMTIGAMLANSEQAAAEKKRKFWG